MNLLGEREYTYKASTFLVTRAFNLTLSSKPPVSFLYKLSSGKKNLHPGLNYTSFKRTGFKWGVTCPVTEPVYPCTFLQTVAASVG